METNTSNNISNTCDPLEAGRKTASDTALTLNGDKGSTSWSGIDWDDQSSVPASSVASSPTEALPLEDNDCDAGRASHRPESLVLPQPLQQEPKRSYMSRDNSISACSDSSIIRSKSTDEMVPLDKQGIVTTEGDMVSFVTDDLAQKIRLSSPLSQAAEMYWSGPGAAGVHTPGSVSSAHSGWSSSSASGWSGVPSAMSRSPSGLTQSPEEIPPVDPRALYELELASVKVASDLEKLTKLLRSNMHKMSAITKGCVDAYTDGVDSTCDAVDANIKSMYALMAKCEELSASMKPIYTTADKIKEVKRLVALFESYINKEETEAQKLLS